MPMLQICLDTKADFTPKSASHISDRRTGLQG